MANDDALSQSTQTAPGDPSASVQDQPQAPPMQDMPPATMTQGPTQAQAPAAAPGARESKWAHVVKGALAGFLMGGAPGAIEGAIAPTMSRNELQNRLQMRQEQVRAAHLSNDLHTVQIMQAQRTLEMAPKSVQEKYLNEAINQNDALVRGGAMEPATGSFVNKHEAVDALAQAHQNSPFGVFDIRPVRGNDGGIEYQVFQYPHAPLQQDVTINGLDGKPMTIQKGRPADEVGKFLVIQGQNFLKLNNGLAMIAQRHENTKADETQKQDNRVALEGLKQGNREKLITLRPNAQYKEFTGANGATYYMPVAQGAAAGLPTGKTSSQIQPFIKTAEDSEKSYQMFQDAYADHQKGTETGAASMLALSAHLATTFGNVKGARVTKDMIKEHLGARSVSDDALVAIQKLTNGEKLSEGQWQEFGQLIGGSRRYSWGTAAKESSNRGVSIRDLVPKDLGGTGDIHELMLGARGATPQAPASTPAAASGSQPATSRPPLDSFRRK